MTEHENNANLHAKAATAYQTAYVSNVSGMDIVVELYKGMIGNIKQAKAAYQAGKLDEMCRLNDKTIKILVALQSHLDFEEGADAAEYLNKFYNSIFASLTKILRKPSPERSFDQIIAAIEPVYQRWCEFAAGQHVIGKN